MYHRYQVQGGMQGWAAKGWLGLMQHPPPEAWAPIPRTQSEEGGRLSHAPHHRVLRNRAGLFRTGVAMHPARQVTVRSGVPGAARLPSAFDVGFPQGTVLPTAPSFPHIDMVWRNAGRMEPSSRIPSRIRSVDVPSSTSGLAFIDRRCHGYGSTCTA